MGHLWCIRHRLLGDLWKLTIYAERTPSNEMRLFVGYFTSKQHASVSREQICSDNCTCYRTKIEVAVTQSQYSDSRPAKPNDDPITPGALQGSYWSANFQVTGMTRARKITGKAGIEPRVCRSRGGRLYHEVNEAVKKKQKNPTNNKQKQKHAITHFYCLHFEPALIPMHTCVFAFFSFGVCKWSQQRGDIGYLRLLH